MHTTYITPAGYICTCGKAYPTATGAGAHRFGRIHANDPETHGQPSMVVDTRCVTDLARATRDLFKSVTEARDAFAAAFTEIDTALNTHPEPKTVLVSEDEYADFYL